MNENLEKVKIGYVYCLTNVYMPGICEVGYTSKDPIIRSREISSPEGVLGCFKVEFFKRVENARTSKRYIHSLLDELGIEKTQPRKEFFIRAPDDIKKLFEKLIEFDE